MEEQSSDGQILYSAYRQPEGGRLSNWRKKEVRLDLISSEDEATLAQKGLTALRKARIVRLSSQTAEQGAVLTYDDLVHLLTTSLSTVRRDVRVLQREGFSIPLYRCRGRRLGVVVIPMILAILFSSKVEAQLSSIFGSTGFDYDYEAQETENATTSRQLFRQQYQLGVDGRILDPRLAVFSLSSTFVSTFLEPENTKALSLAGNLSLLQAKAFGLTLKGSESFARNGVETDVTSTGALLRLSFPNWPQLFIDFDRLALESRGDSRSEITVTTTKARFSHRFWSTMLNGELGIQSFTDPLADTSQERFFGRLNSTVTLSPATVFRSVSDGFLLGNQLSMRSSYSLENRPDATLSRSVSLGFRSTKAGEDQAYSLDLSGALSKSFSPYSWLQANTFTSAGAAKEFGSQSRGGFNWSGGSSVALSYFRPVRVLADYTLGVSYETDIAKLETIQQAHLGLVSRTLDPLRLSGDYFSSLQTGLTESTRHFISGRADIVLTPSLSLRSFADFLTEDSRSSLRSGVTTGEAATSTERTATSVGAGASYRPFLDLALDLSGRIQWTESRKTSDTTMGANVGLFSKLPIWRRPTLNINGLWERFTVNQESRFEVKSQLNYILGLVTLTLQHRFESRETSGVSGRTNSIRVSLHRPFRIGF
ncbi:MAG: DUF1670 domain-containing protein [Candidatus Binatia bacterium]